MCDDFYVNMNLGTEMELPANRETVLHFFERVQKTYPTMRNFYCRERGDFVLEEDKDRGLSLVYDRAAAGVLGPGQSGRRSTGRWSSTSWCWNWPRTCSRSARWIARRSICLFGFDFTYRGNHNQLMAEVLGVSPSMEPALEVPGATVINYEPSMTIALDADCRTQLRISVETRTNAYQVRMGEYPEEQLSVYVTARQYGSLAPDKTFVETLDRLRQLCHETIDDARDRAHSSAVGAGDCDAVGSGSRSANAKL